jgi:tetratricopeptide (TPR) repeat protein
VVTRNSTHNMMSNEPALVAWAIQRAAYPDVLRRLERAFAAGKVAQLIREVTIIEATYPADRFNEQVIDSAAFAFLVDNQPDAAMVLFQLNVDRHPDSWKSYDSLAEAYLLQQLRDLAIHNYERSLALNPQNAHAQQMLRGLKSEYDPLPVGSPEPRTGK